MGGFTLHSDPASKQMWQVREKYVLPHLCLFTERMQAIILKVSKRVHTSQERQTGS